MARESTERWAALAAPRVVPFADDPARFSRLPWPLPVGTGVTREAHVHRPFGGATYEESYSVQWQPVPGDAYACVALTARTGDTLIEMFGLCDVREGSNPPPGAAYRARAHRDNSIAWRLAPGQVALPAPYAESLRSQVVVITPGRLTFRVVGNAVDPTAVAFMRSAQRWWKHMEVRWRSEGGRPPNQPQTRYELVLDAIRDLRESDEDYPGAAAPKIDQESVGQWMLPPISNRTVRRTVKEAKKSWAEALTDASVKFTGYR